MAALFGRVSRLTRRFRRRIYTHRDRFERLAPNHRAKSTRCPLTGNAAFVPRETWMLRMHEAVKVSVLEFHGISRSIKRHSFFLLSILGEGEILSPLRGGFSSGVLCLEEK